MSLLLTLMGINTILAIASFNTDNVFLQLVYIVAIFLNAYVYHRSN